MTIIEFYDKTSIENIGGTLLCKPEQMILIGNNKRHLEKAIALYQEVLEKNNINTKLSYRTINKNNLRAIIDVLSQIAEESEECVFDLTGGEDLYLAAVGAILERYPDRTQCHLFNFKTDTLIDCDADGTVCNSSPFKLSIEDNIKIYGGELVTNPQMELYTYPWDFSASFEQDIDTMWDICRKNPKRWNAQIGTLGAICEVYGLQDSLSVSFNQDSAASAIKPNGIKYACIPWILYDLQKHGLIHSLVLQDTVSFVFKNEQIKKTLTTAGQILELVVAKTMRTLCDNDGIPIYHDVKVGVVIDWDQKDEEYHTFNEIDVMAMKGNVPIFISCKNGNFDANELYKLNTVANRFGNKYAKKVLVSTELDKLGPKSDYIRARMEDMQIRNIENVDEMSDYDFVKALKSLWSN